MELPLKYYWDNFEYLLGFVTDKYKDLLVASEWSFLRKYYTLPENAQLLFIRFTNRKGLFFKIDSIKYAEIEDISGGLKILHEKGFIASLHPKEHELWTNEILNVLNRQELAKIFDIKGALKKDELVENVKQSVSPAELISGVASLHDIVKVNFEVEVSFLRFLFFGNRTMDMTEFVLRDLGLVQYYKHTDDDLVARFSTRKEAEDKWLVSEQYLVFSELKTTAEPAAIYDWYRNFKDNNKELSLVALPAWQKLQLNIGKHFEKLKRYDLAVDLFQEAAVPPSQERRVRCLAKAGFYEEAKLVCQEMISSPANVDEQYFAEYFLQTISGKKNKKKTTEWLNEADEIYISPVYRHQVEFGAMEYYIEKGFSAGFSENYSWRALFGLLFWDIIFDPSLVAFHHPFQRRPSDLFLPDFYEKRQDQVHNRLESITDSDELVAFLWANFEKHYGTANPFVVWMEEVWAMVKVLASYINWDVLKKVMLKIAENIVENSRGLPDILIWDMETYELIEIKSPNDTLSNQQLFWLQYFKELGINARVLRVKFLSI